MGNNKTQKIFRWVFVLWLMVFFATIIICYFLFKSTLDYTNFAVEESVSLSSIEINNKIDKQLQTLKDMSLGITDEMLNDPKLGMEYLSTIKEELDYKELSIASLDGTTYITSGLKVNISETDYFQAALSGESNIGNLVPSSDHLDWVNIYFMPIYRESKVAGILWGSIKADHLYKELGISSISNFGDTLVVDSETNFIVGDINKIGDTSFYHYHLEHESGEEINENHTSMDMMKKDMSNNKNGFQKFKYDNESYYFYYNKLNVNDWWVLTRVPTATLHDFIINQIKITLILIGILFVLVNIGFYQIIQRLVKLNKNILNESFKDLVTGGKNDNYLNYHIGSLIKKPEDKVLIGVKITNIDILVKVLGITQVNEQLKEFYNKVNLGLQENEVVVHSFFGDFKIFKEYKGIKSIIDYIDFINSIDSEFKLIIGIYQIEENMTDYSQMCLHTTVAKSNLKENCNYGFYSKDIHEEILKKNLLEADINQGIKAQEFKAWFQPKYKSDGKTLVGAEALVRWYKEDQVIGPGYFVPLCESNHMMKELDLSILEDVCKQLKKWIQEKKSVVPISVNLSRTYLDQPDFIDKIIMMVEFYQIPKNLLEFEITETSMEGNKENLIKMIDVLHQRGFKVALDDFGVGYSSIQTLVSMNFDTIKIDKVFVDGIGNEKWNNIIKYAISLCKQLQATIVAEGVETKEQLDFLARNGCDYIQGYYLGKPMDAINFEKLIDK